jgi:hypothetical protein
VFPYGGTVLLAASAPTQIRRQKDGGGWSVISIGDFTDLLSAARFYSEVITTFGTFQYDLEVTLADSTVLTFSVDVVCGLDSVDKGKIAIVDTAVAPFSDVVFASDSSLLDAIEYDIEGDAVVSLTAITRLVKYEGAHTGGNNEAVLTESNQDFTTLNITIDEDILQNITDGSEGIISARTTSTLTATLSGGTDNDWDTSDTYKVLDGSSLDLIAKQFEYTFTSAGHYRVQLTVTDTTANTATIVFYIEAH